MGFGRAVMVVGHLWGGLVPFRRRALTETRSHGGQKTYDATPLTVGRGGVALCAMVPGLGSHDIWAVSMHTALPCPRCHRPGGGASGRPVTMAEAAGDRVRSRTAVETYISGACVRRRCRMNTKLTLRLDDTLIRQAKQHAHREGKSLSQLVSDYFRAIQTRERKRTLRRGPITAKLHGCIKGADVGEEDYRKYLRSKYR